ncbi:MAG TPA: BppU family phage baseplate upper protein [Caproicibacter sp.]|nr:BppU family phage baseplate upper protein [Caproicibacter sp.]
MTKLQVTLNVWDTRFSKATAIQGENGSRIIEVTFVGKVSPIDLTGCTPRMVVNNGADQPPMNDGVIVDAAGGVADFSITSDMLERVGDWPCEFALSGPNYPLLKVHGLVLPVEASNTENAIGSSNQLGSLWIALNKADAAEATAQQAAAESRQAAIDSQAAVATANQANATATIAAVNANNAASAANQAANDTRSYYQMMDPTTGKVDYVTNIIKNLEAYIFNGAITAGEFDALNITAGAFDALNITALDFDTRAKSILGVS